MPDNCVVGAPQNAHAVAPDRIAVESSESFVANNIEKQSQFAKDDLRSGFRRLLVKSKGTGPEMVVRRLVHSMGFRYGLHRRDLAGNPDLVFTRLRKAIFVHGCFWHQHHCKRGARRPSSHTDYWLQKLRRNMDRDRRVIRELRKLGWSVLVVWECQAIPKRLKALTARLNRFLSRPNP